jgi:hypothetical protein
MASGSGGGGGTSYAPLDSYSKEALALGDGSTTGTGGEYFDPQGRSGLRYQARQEAFAKENAAIGDPSKGKKKKWWIIAGVVAVLLVGAVVGIAVGVTTANKNKTNNGSGSNTAATNDNNNDGTTVQTGDDPSQFTKDDRLHNSFYGFAYTPQVGGAGGLSRGSCVVVWAMALMGFCDRGVVERVIALVSMRTISASTVRVFWN